MRLRSTFARLLIAGLAAVAVGSAVNQSLPDEDRSWITQVFTEAGDGLDGD